MARPRHDDLTPDKIGDLSSYADDELANLRELLILDLARIDDEGKHCEKRIKAFNERRQDLAHERAERARTIRAIKHQLSQRQRTGLVSPPRGRLRAMR